MALNKALKTDLSALAQIIQSKGRGRDTVLAHITPQEAALLKKRGGSGTINPDTGLPEFFESEDVYGGASAPDAGFSSGEGIYQLGSARTSDQAADSAGFGYQVGPDLSQAAPAYGGYSGEVIPTGGAAQAISSDISPQFQISQPLTAQAFGLPAGTTAPQYKPEEVAAAKPIDEASLFSQAAKRLGVKEDTLGRGALATGLGIYNALQGKQAAAQSAQAAAQKSAIAQPYQQQGKELVGAAQRGELTQANQQVIQQQRARLAQAASNMGGVGQQQIENQISNLTSQLLQNQYQYGLQVMQIGDNIELGAINTQLQLDQQLNAANKSFYLGLGNLVAGSPRYIIPPSTTGNP